MVLQRRRTNKPRHLLRLTMPEEYKRRRRLDGGNSDKQGSGGGKGGNNNDNNNEESKDKGDKDNDDDNKSNGDNNKENDNGINNNEDETSAVEEEEIDNEMPMYVDTDPGPHSEFPNVVLSDYYNNEFVGSLGVGIPPQYFIVVFDTGQYILRSTL